MPGHSEVGPFSWWLPFDLEFLYELFCRAPQRSPAISFITERAPSPFCLITVWDRCLGRNFRPHKMSLSPHELSRRRWCSNIAKHSLISLKKGPFKPFSQYRKIQNPSDSVSLQAGPAVLLPISETPIASDSHMQTLVIKLSEGILLLFLQLWYILGGRLNSGPHAFAVNHYLGPRVNSGLAFIQTFGKCCQG